MTELKPGQIVYIEHQSTRLYAEVIQLVRDRGVCWVRPLAFARFDPQEMNPYDSKFNTTGVEHLALQDLREGADLFCPQSLFHSALDTEVIPVLTHLNTLKPHSEESMTISDPSQSQHIHQRLQEFIRCICQTYPEAFQP